MRGRLNGGSCSTNYSEVPAALAAGITACQSIKPDPTSTGLCWNAKLGAVPAVIAALDSWLLLGKGRSCYTPPTDITPNNCLSFVLKLPINVTTLLSVRSSSG